MVELAIAFALLVVMLAFAVDFGFRLVQTINVSEGTYTTSIKGAFASPSTFASVVQNVSDKYHQWEGELETDDPFYELNVGGSVQRVATGPAGSGRNAEFLRVNSGGSARSLWHGGTKGESLSADFSAPFFGVRDAFRANVSDFDNPEASFDCNGNSVQSANSECVQCLNDGGCTCHFADLCPRG